MFERDEQNPMWKGKNVGIDAIHVWVLRRKQKPEFCEDCKINPPKDLANISQKYHRDINDFEWLCRKCHMSKDGRLESFAKLERPKKPPRLPEPCVSCGKIRNTVSKHYCSTCYRKLRYVEKKCIDCGKTFLSDGRPHHKRCSKACMLNSAEYRKLRSEIAKKRTGEGNPNYRHGKYMKLNNTDFINAVKALQ